MKCRKCTSKAAINMRQHKLALCPDHFVEWVQNQTERFIHKYEMFTREDRVLVAVSGGKDSLALWDILTNLGYQTDGLYIGLGIDGGIVYSDESLRCAQAFAEARNLMLHTIDITTEYGASIPLAAQIVSRRKYKPCSVCGLSRRHIMNRIARDSGYNVLATGHNLDDEAATLFGNTLQWAVGYLERQGPVLPADDNGLVKKVKPLFRFYEREMAAYALVRGIEYMYEECPFSVGAKSIQHKELLNQLEAQRPGAKLQFYLRFLHARQEHGIFISQPQAADLHPCDRCGQPTISPDLCSFCRTWDRIQVSQTEKVMETPHT